MGGPDRLRDHPPADAARAMTITQPPRPPGRTTTRDRGTPAPRHDSRAPRLTHHRKTMTGRVATRPNRPHERSRLADHRRILRDRRPRLNRGRRHHDRSHQTSPGCELRDCDKNGACSAKKAAVTEPPSKNSKKLSRRSPGDSSLELPTPSTRARTEDTAIRHLGAVKVARRTGPGADAGDRQPQHDDELKHLFAAWRSPTPECSIVRRRQVRPVVAASLRLVENETTCVSGVSSTPSSPARTVSAWSTGPPTNPSTGSPTRLRTATPSTPTAHECARSTSEPLGPLTGPPRPHLGQLVGQRSQAWPSA